MSRTVRVRLVGPAAAPGSIAADDVARLIIGLERSMARAAYLVLHRTRRRSTGRHTKAVEAAAKLLFVGVEQGSFVQLLGLPDVAPLTDEELDLDVTDLSIEAFDRVVAAIEEPSDNLDWELALAISQLADQLDVGGRTTTITLGRSGAGNRSAVIDESVKQTMRRLSEASPSHEDDHVIGTFVEADFEHRTARLRTQTGSPVVVSFPEQMQEVVKQALRETAEVRGQVTYDPRTGSAKRVDVRRVVKEEQLTLFADDDQFEEHLTIDQLRLEQGIREPVDLAGIYLDDWTEDERDAFAEALADA